MNISYDCNVLYTKVESTLHCLCMNILIGVCSKANKLNQFETEMICLLVVWEVGRIWAWLDFMVRKEVKQCLPNTLQWRYGRLLCSTLSSCVCAGSIWCSDVTFIYLWYEPFIKCISLDYFNLGGLSETFTN